MSSRTLILIILVLLSPIFVIFYELITYCPDVPTIKETWWTNGNRTKEDKNIYPFKINISQQILEDLSYRLNNTRQFAKPLQDNQIYGFNSDLAQDILKYWKTNYNWKERESIINELPHFITSIQGLKIHFIRFKPKKIPPNIKVLPLLISHGWPSSFLEYSNVIPRLTTPRKDHDFVFDVVVPSIPGFGFSDPAQKPGLGAPEIALIFKNLMNRLGFQRFYLHAGDIGYMISKSMATSFEASVLGFHSNTCISLRPVTWFKLFLGSFYPNWIKRQSHRELYYPLSSLFSTFLMETGYLHQQTTKPDTFGVALDDSPMGMAVHFLEKFSTGLNILFRLRKDGGLKENYNYDELLDNIMIYWVTKTGTTSSRFYSESFYGQKMAAIGCLPVKVPTACLKGTYDIISPNELLEDLFPNLVHSSDHEVGHYIGFENPKLLADDIFEAISKMEKVNQKKYEEVEEKQKIVCSNENRITEEL